MAMTPTQESVLAESSLRQIVSQYHGDILPAGHPKVRFVEKVARRIINAIDSSLVPANTNWRVFVIESSTANAFVLPGGDIFVFTGMLSVTESEEGLAAVIGHEVAHQLARHGAEKLSFYQFFGIASSLFKMLVMGDFEIPFEGVLQNLFLFLPFSRKCESEADYIGLLLMAKACYDPSNAVSLWERMQQKSKGRDIPAFISTHPSHGSRVEKLRGWMAEAQREYAQAACHEPASLSLFGNASRSRFAR